MSKTDERIAIFKADLVKLDPTRVVQKHITLGETAVLTPSQHFDIRCKVSDKFGIHPHDVFIVGSAKLGFSIKPKRRYGEFGNTSDVDLAIVSTELFVILWRELQNFIDSGGYWEKLDKFREKFFDGWIRPDLMPSSKSMDLTRDWWEFFRMLTESGQFGDYKIAAGVYYDQRCLERYQLRAVTSCRDEVKVS